MYSRGTQGFYMVHRNLRKLPADTLAGFSFEWSDEFWKNRLQKGCPAAAGLPNFTWAGCVDQSHYDCQVPLFPLIGTPFPAHWDAVPRSLVPPYCDHQ